MEHIMVVKTEYKPAFFAGIFSVLALLVFAVLLGFAGLATAQDVHSADKSSNGVSSNNQNRYRVFRLKYITAEEGKRLLADANIMAVSKLNGDETLLITAPPAVLVRAAAIVTLIDSPKKYAVKALMPVSEAGQMANIDAIQTEIGGISIGTFLNPPGGTALKAIIDIYEDTIYAVAPEEVIDKIADIARGEKQTGIDDSQLFDRVKTENKDTSKEAVEPDKLFNELLSSIAEAEKGVSDEKKNIVSPANLSMAKPLAAKDLNLPAAKDDNEAARLKSDATRRAYEPSATTNGDDKLELALPETMQVIDLLELMGKYLNLNYVYKKADIEGKEVHLKIQGPIKVKELYPLAESIMKFTGLAMSRKGNLVTIVLLTDAMEIDPTLIDVSRGQVQTGDVIVTRIFQLSYIDNASAKNLLEQMKLGSVTEAGPGTIIVTGYAFRMERVEELLEIVDKPGKPKQFKYRQLQFTSAKNLAPKVKQLVEQMGDISIAISRAESPSQPTRGVPVRRPGPTPQPQPTSSESAKPTVFLDADERTNRILMIGQEAELAVVEDLIDALDIAQQDLRSLRVYEIQHVDAEEVRKKLEELGIVGASRASSGTPGRITGRANIAGAQGQPGAPPVASPVPSGSSNPEAELPTEEIQVVVVEATNSLLVNASPEQHAMVATIISYVDSEAEQKALPYKVYLLQNQPPDHICEILTKLVQEVVHDKEGKIDRVVKKTEDNITIVPDANTFSLIVYANKKNQDWISDLIKNLDKRRPQVLIDVTLVEVTSNAKFDLDIDLASKFPKMVPGGQMDVLSSIVGGAGSDTEFLKGTRTEAFSSPGTGKAQGFYSDEHIQVLLTALESKNYGRVLAKPKILVNDGQVGLIKTTDTTHVQISTAVVPQENIPVTTSTDFRPYDTGISLTIQPNIGEGDLLLLIVQLERIDVTSQIGDRPPDTSASNVETIVTVPNGKTIILGGLLRLNQSKGSTKVPLLGDIPIVGGLFRSTDNQNRDSKLYVFVRANILRPEAIMAGMSDLERFSEKSRQAFEKSEDLFQTHQDWPGIKPKPVEPIRVLDAE